MLLLHLITQKFNNYQKSFVKTNCRHLSTVVSLETTKIIQAIVDYLKYRTIDRNHIIVNSFHYDNTVYFLNAADTQNMYNIIVDVSTDKAKDFFSSQYQTSFLDEAIRKMLKTFNKKYSLEPQKRKRNYIKNNHDKDYDILFEKEVSILQGLLNNEKSRENLIYLISKTLSYFLFQNIVETFYENKKMPYETSYSNLSYNLGKVVSDYVFEFLLDKYNLKTKTEYSYVRILKKITQTFSSVDGLNRIIAFYKTQGIYFSYDKFYYWFAKNHLIYLLTTKYPDQKKQAKKEIWDSLQFNQDSILTNKQILSDKFMIKLNLKLGSLFVDLCIENKILIEELKDRTRYVILNGKYVENVSRSACFSKPYLSAGNIFQRKKFDLDNTFSFQLSGDDSEISSIRNFENYQVSDKLKNLLKNEDTKFCINREFLKLYLYYLEFVFNLDFNIIFDEPNSETSDIIFNFFYTHFFINLKDIVLNKSLDRKFVEKLLNFSKDFNKLYDIDFYKQLDQARKLDSKTEKLKILKTSSFSNYWLNVFIGTEKKPNSTSNSREKDLNKLKLEYFNIVSGYKFFLFGFIQDAFLYSHLQHFLIPNTIAYVGRIFTKPFFLNLQTSNFVKGFIHCYRDNLKDVQSESDFQVFKKVINSNIQTSFIKENIDKMTFNEFNIKNETYVSDFIKSFFNNDIIIHEFKVDSDLKTSLNKIINKIKKPKNIIWALSLLYYQQNKNEYKNSSPYLQVDATSSGLQHIAMLLKNKTLGTLSNLIGFDKKDIHTNFTLDFKYFLLTELPEYTSEIYKRLNLSKQDLLTNKKTFVTNICVAYLRLFNLSPSEKMLNVTHSANSMLLNIEYILLRHGLLDIFIFNKKTISEKFPNYSDLFYKKLNAIFKDDYCIRDRNNKRIKVNINILPSLIPVAALILDAIVSDIFDEITWLKDVSFDRDIAKSRIMPQAYGMTLQGGFKAILNGFKEKSHLIGSTKIDKSRLSMFCTIYNYYLARYFEPNFLDIKTYLNLGVLISQFKQPIQMTNPNLSWTYKPYHRKSFEFSIKRFAPYVTVLETEERIIQKKVNRRTINFQLKMNSINHGQIRQAICAFIIHTSDSYLMQSFLFTSNIISKNLRDNRILFSDRPNHDCIYSLYNHGYISKLIFLDAYNVLNNEYFFNFFRKTFENPVGITEKEKKRRNKLLLGISKSFTAKDHENYLGDMINNENFSKF